MSLLTESVFPIVDYIAQRLIYVGWVPTFVAMVTLCMSSDKEHQLTRMARISSIATPCTIVFYISYFLLNPEGAFTTLVRNAPFTFIYISSDFCPIFWMVYGNDAIVVDVKGFSSRLPATKGRNRNSRSSYLSLGFVYFMEACVTLGGGLFFMVSVALSVAYRQVPEESGILFSVILSAISLWLLGTTLSTKNKEIKRRMAEERLAANSAVVAKADLANMKNEKF